MNSGSDKTLNAIIDCNKNYCFSNKAMIDWLLHDLIQCTSPSSCIEFTPTINYCDNVDSSERINTIINCVQTSQSLLVFLNKLIMVSICFLFQIFWFIVNPDPNSGQLLLRMISSIEHSMDSLVALNVPKTMKLELKLSIIFY